jgi:uncharacterized BrkB/YihY/UPF0761 family membrane protein
MSPMDPVRKVMGAVDGFQRRYRWLGVPYAVQKKFGDDNANLVTVALAWYGFTAIFPLLLVVVTVFGFIHAQSLGTDLLNTLHQFPVIGSSFNPAKPSDLHGSSFGLVIGLVGLIYGAQGVTQTAQLAMATVWNIPRDQRTGFLPRLGRSIAGLITIGGAFLINAFASTYATGSGRSYEIRVPVELGLLIINIGLYLASFFLLTAKAIGPRGLIPGAVLGGTAFTALITLGTGLINHQLNHANATYGAFGAVIGIVAFLLLLAKLSLYAAELNPVLSRGLYPRALPLGGDPTEADLQVLSHLVHQEKRRDDQAIGVGFGKDAAEEAASDARGGVGQRQTDASNDADEESTDGQEAAEARHGVAPQDETDDDAPQEGTDGGAAADPQSRQPRHAGGDPVADEDTVGDPAANGRHRQPR